MADNRPARMYNCSDRNFITAGQVLITHFTDHKARFLEVRSDMADPFGPNLKIRIDTAADVNLGETRNQGARASSADLKVAKELAKEKVSLLKGTIESRFKDSPADRSKYVSALGLDLHYSKFYSGSDESAFELYTKMKTALAGPIKAELVAKGLAAGLMDNALAALLPLQPLNVSQETEKGQGKELTDAGINEFNAIYKILIDICDQGKVIFKAEPAIQQKFVWDRLI